MQATGCSSARSSAAVDRLPMMLAGTIAALLCASCSGVRWAGSEPAPTVRWVFQAGSRLYSSPVAADLAQAPGLEILIVSSAERKLICLSPPARVLWSYDGFVLRNTSTPTVADLDGDGRAEILIGSRRPGVVCLDGAGSRRWERPVPGGLPWGSVVVADADRNGTPEVYWMGRSGLVECHGPNGDRLWDRRVTAAGSEGPADGSPAVGDVDGDGRDEIVVPGLRNVACLRHDGTEMWVAEFVSWFGSGPVIADVCGDRRPEILVGSDEGVLYCLAGHSGRILWTHRTFGTRIATSIAVGDLDGDARREIVYGDGLGNLYCLDGAGAERWSFPTEDWIESAPVIGDVDGDGRVEVVFGSADGRVYCLSHDGRQKWAFDTGSRISASPTLCDHDGDGTVEILVGAHNGCLYCLSCGGRRGARSELWPSRRYDLRQTGCLPQREDTR